MAIEGVLHHIAQVIEHVEVAQMGANAKILENGAEIIVTADQLDVISCESTQDLTLSWTLTVLMASWFSVFRKSFANRKYFNLGSKSSSDDSGSD